MVTDDLRKLRAQFLITVKGLGDDGEILSRQVKGERFLWDIEKLVSLIMEGWYSFGELDEPGGRIHIPPHRLLSVTVEQLSEPY